MAIDKAIDYVAQDGVKNYIKNSKSVTVPKEFKARKNAPATKLAYITADEAKMLKKMKKGTPHKGPKGIPSYDSFDAQGNFRTGAEMSAAESGDKGAFGRDPGAMKEAQDIRSSAIAAGAGQRVNPGFFDSKNVISPEELKRAREYANRPGNLFAKKAMRKTRGGGIMDFLTGGGFTGALVKGIGRALGLGKRFNEPTYDMRQLSNLNFLPNNRTFQNNLGNEELLSLLEDNDGGGGGGGIDGIISALPKSDIDSQFQSMVIPIGMNEKQKTLIDKAATMYGNVNAASDGTPAKLDETKQKEIFDNVKKFDTEAEGKLFGFVPFTGQEADPLTEQEYKDYLISQGYI